MKWDCKQVNSPAKCAFWNQLLRATVPRVPAFTRKNVVDKDTCVHLTHEGVDLGYVVRSRSGEAQVEVRVDVKRNLLGDPDPDRVMAYKSRLESWIKEPLGRRVSPGRCYLLWTSALRYRPQDDNSALIADLVAKMETMYKVMQLVKL